MRIYILASLFFVTLSLAIAVIQESEPRSLGRVVGYGVSGVLIVIAAGVGVTLWRMQ